MVSPERRAGQRGLCHKAVPAMTRSCGWRPALTSAADAGGAVRVRSGSVDGAPTVRQASMGTRC